MIDMKKLEKKKGTDCVRYCLDSCEKYFPIDILWKRSETDMLIDIVDSLNQYTPPKIIVDKESEILASFGNSVIFDNNCIRLKKIEVVGNKLLLYTERTRYFFTLMTNRRMDFIIDNQQSIRDIFEPDKALSSLADSKMSNHIGFSVLVETLDKCLVFVKRNGRVSTKKNVIDCGVSGSLKSKYALTENGILTVKGFFDAISKEIVDELHLPTISKVRITEKNMLALYRDVLEGGKPNFIFFCSIGYTSTELHSFVCEYHDDDMIVDLDKLLIIDISRFINSSIGFDYILFQSDNEMSKMPISPSTGGVLVLLKEYLYKKERL